MKIAICSLSHFTYVAEFIDAAELLNENHEVKYFLGFESQGAVELLEARGIDYEVLLDSPPSLRMPAEISATDELFRDFFFKQAELVLPLLLERLEKWQPSILLSHLRDYSGITAAELLNLPVVSFGSYAPPSRVPHLDPPFGAGVGRGASPATIRFMWKMQARFNEKVDDYFNKTIRHAYGLKSMEAVSTWASSKLTLLSIIPSLGCMNTALPSHIKYVGRLYSKREKVAKDRESAFISRISALPSPRVFLSLGTTYADILLKKCVGALAGFEGGLIISTGGTSSEAIDGKWINSVVAPFFEDIDSVVSMSDAVVTVSGGKTVMATLSHGVPMICLPQQGEQKEIAMALRACGAADIPCVRKWSSNNFSNSVTRVVSDFAYRDAAIILKGEAGRYDGAKEAVGHIVKMAKDCTTC